MNGVPLLQIHLDVLFIFLEGVEILVEEGFVFGLPNFAEVPFDFNAPGLRFLFLSQDHLPVAHAVVSADLRGLLRRFEDPEVEDGRLPVPQTAEPLLHPDDAGVGSRIINDDFSEVWEAQQVLVGDVGPAADVFVEIDVDDHSLLVLENVAIVIVVKFLNENEQPVLSLTAVDQGQIGAQLHQRLVREDSVQFKGSKPEVGSENIQIL